MQAQTIRKSYGTAQKLAGGALIAAALAAGAIGLTIGSDLKVPGTGGSASVVSAPQISLVAVRHHGEGLPLSVERPAIAAETPRASGQARELGFPHGEGFPMVDLEQADTRTLSPMGEGLLERGSSC
jgi:hypothetical protein